MDPAPPPQSITETHQADLASPGATIDTVIADTGRSLPDPAYLLAAITAVRMGAEATAAITDDGYALYSPAQVAQLMTEAAGAIEALAHTVHSAGWCLHDQAAAGWSRSPDHLAQIPGRTDGDAVAVLYRAAARLARTAPKIAQIPYSGYTDGGTPGQALAVAEALRVIGAEASEPTHVGQIGGGVRTMVEFTFGPRRARLCHDPVDLGWYLQEWDQGWTELAMGAAVTSTVHPEVIADAAVYILETQLAAPTHRTRPRPPHPPCGQAPDPALDVPPATQGADLARALEREGLRVIGSWFGPGQHDTPPTLARIRVLTNRDRVFELAATPRWQLRLHRDGRLHDVALQGAEAPFDAQEAAAKAEALIGLLAYGWVVSV